MNDNYWVQQQEIVRTIVRYFIALDDRDFTIKTFASIFTDNGMIVRPNGTTLTGPAEIAASHAKSFARFKVTQHLLSGYDVVIDNDSAHVRVNLVAIHLWNEQGNDANLLGNHFTAGTVLNVQLKRQDDTWKIHSLDNKAVWRDGVGINNMAQTDKESNVSGY